MAREVNVIVSAYATTPFMTGPGLEMFDEETVLVEVPFTLQSGEGLADKAFKRTVDRLKDWKDGSVLRALFRQQLKGKTPRSVAVITFSAGTTFAKAVLSGSDAEWVDTVICLDGLHIPKNWQGAPIGSVLEPWIQFGERAAFDERMMVLADTDIVPFNHNQITSTSESSELVLVGVEENLGERAGRFLQAPSYVNVSASGARAVSNLGNFWVLEYGGTQGSDHIRVAKVESTKIWKSFLVPRWNAGVTCRAPDLAGLGAVECTPNRVVAPPGAFGTDVVRDYVVPFAVAGLIFGGTYWAGTKIARYV